MRAELDLRFNHLRLKLATDEQLLDEDANKLIALQFSRREYSNEYVSDDSPERREFLRVLVGEIANDFPLEVTYMGHTVRHNDIKEEDISRTWSASSHFPEQTARQYLADRMRHFKSVVDQFVRLGDTPEKIELLKGEWRAYTRRDDEYFKAWLAATARTASAFVTGPSKFPTERNAKRLATAERRAAEWREFRERRMSRITRVLRRLGRTNTSPLDEAREKLAQRQQLQEEYKAINKACRSADPEGALLLLGYKQEKVNQLLNPEYGSTGVPAYLLDNNRAEIRRLTRRVEQLEQAEALGVAGTEDEVYGPVVLHQAHDLQRVQLRLPDKPSAEQRSLLKRRGFRWAPTLQVWQRQLTDNGLQAAREVAKQLGGV